MSDLVSHVEIKRGSNKNFGYVFSTVFLLLSFAPVFFGKSLNIIFLCIALILLTLTCLKPSVFLYPNIIWFKFGIILGSIISPVVMALIYFVAFYPFGLAFKVLRKDLLKIDFNNDADTYWQDRDREIQSMKNQF